MCSHELMKNNQNTDPSTVEIAILPQLDSMHELEENTEEVAPHKFMESCLEQMWGRRLLSEYKRISSMGRSKTTPNWQIWTDRRRKYAVGRMPKAICSRPSRTLRSDIGWGLRKGGMWCRKGRSEKGLRIALTSLDMQSGRGESALRARKSCQICRRRRVLLGGREEEEGIASPIPALFLILSRIVKISHMN